MHGLRRVLPRRRAVPGKRPEVFGAGPMGRTVGDTEQWIFPDIVLTEEEKTRILAAVTGMMVETLFDSHLYTLGGRVFKQAGGGPIGLRGTCAVARLIMNVWDTTWESMMKSMSFAAELYVRRLIHGSMQGVVDFLKFSTETEEEFSDGPGPKGLG